jgi:hypothetical protein
MQGWKFWPDPPKGPVDDAYVQRRWIRPYRIGPVRLVFGIMLAVVTLYPSMIAVLIGLSGRGGQIWARLVWLVLSLAVVALAATAVGRCFTAGVYVNDFGIKVVRLWRTVPVAWPNVVDVVQVSGGSPLLGISLMPVPAHAVWITTADGNSYRTPITSVSPDFLGRSEAFAAGATALEQWYRDARKRA